MNEWNKVEKKKKTFSKQDEYYEYFKLFILICIGLAYMYALWF